MIRIAMAEHAEEHVALAISPLLECVLSLHVLLGPKHHALQHDWVRRMRGLDPALRREIGRNGFVWREQIPDAFLPTADGAPESFDEELARFRRLPPEVLLDALGRPLVDHGGRGSRNMPAARSAALRRAATLGNPARSAAAALFDNPAGFAERLSELLDRYWATAFEAEWARIAEPLEQSIIDAGRTLAGTGVWPVLGRLPAHCRVDREQRELRIDLPHDHRVEVSAGNPLLLCPSFFVWPHLRVNCDPPWPLTIVYATADLARQVEPRIPQPDLLRTLRALADDTRLRVLKLIAEHPRTTQELEPLVGLSRAGLSKSLRRLAEAGLVSTKRDGYYVVYSLDPDRIRALGPAVAEYLEATD